MHTNRRTHLFDRRSDIKKRRAEQSTDRKLTARHYRRPPPAPPRLKPPRAMEGLDIRPEARGAAENDRGAREPEKPREMPEDRGAVKLRDGPTLRGAEKLRDGLTLRPDKLREGLMLRGVEKLRDGAILRVPELERGVVERVMLLGARPEMPGLGRIVVADRGMLGDT